jgi:hypothetical protein
VRSWQVAASRKCDPFHADDSWMMSSMVANGHGFAPNTGVTEPLGLTTQLTIRTADPKVVMSRKLDMSVAPPPTVVVVRM